MKINISKISYFLFVSSLVFMSGFSLGNDSVLASKQFLALSVISLIFWYFIYKFIEDVENNNIPISLYGKPYLIRLAKEQVNIYEMMLNDYKKRTVG